MKRRLVQSYAKLAFFPLEESGFPSPVNNTFLGLRVRANKLTNEVRNEESCCAVNLGCSDNARCCRHRRGAAADEDPAEGIRHWCFLFRSWYLGTYGGLPTGTARAWLC